MPPDIAIAKPKYAPPSHTASFLNLPGTFEYLLSGNTSRPRLPDELLGGGATATTKNVILILIDGWGWKKAFDSTLPLVSRISRDSTTLIRQIDSGFPTTTAAMLPSLYTGQPPVVHGYVEWRHYEESLGAVINVLPWPPHSVHRPPENPLPRRRRPRPIPPKGP